MNLKKKKELLEYKLTYKEEEKDRLYYIKNKKGNTFFVYQI